MRIAKVFWLFIIFFTSIMTNAQIIQILNSATGEVITDVHVTNGSDTVYTNDNGECDISLLPGHSNIFFYHSDYYPQLLRKRRIRSSKYQLKLVPLDIYIPEITVQAKRIQQRAHHVTQKLESIRLDSVSNFGTSAADLLANESNVYVQKSQLGGGSPMLRGFSANSVLLVMDGVRMNNAIYRSGNLQNILNIDPLSLENVNIIYGPGSVLFGSDALGGVMAFTSLQPVFGKNTGSVYYQYGSAANSNTAHFDFSTGRKKWAFTTSISASSVDHLRMGKYGNPDYVKAFQVEPGPGNDLVQSKTDTLIQSPSAYKQLNLLQKVRFKPKKNLDLIYTLSFSNTSDIPRYDRNLQLQDGLPKYAEWYYGPQTWFFQAFNINDLHSHLFKDELHLTLGHQFYRESRHDRKLNDSNRRSRTENIHIYSLNLDFQKQLLPSLKLDYGAEITLNSARSSGSSQNIYDLTKVKIEPRYPSTSIYTTAAIFSSTSWEISEKLMLDAGARYSYIFLDSDLGDNFYNLPYQTIQLRDGALVGNLGMNYLATNHTTFYASLSSGFRAPNIDDVAKVFDAEPGSVMVPNPNLESEYSVNAEIGIKWQIFSWMKIDAAAFHTYLDNAMVRQPFMLNGASELLYDGELLKIQALQNTGFAQISGIQGAINFQMNQHWSVQTHMTYMEGEDDQHQGLRHIPPAYGKSSIKYKYTSFFVEVFGLYNFEKPFDKMALSEINKPHIYAKDEDGNPYSPAWCTFNIRGSWDINKTLTLNLTLENIFDQRYRPYSSGIAAPGTNFLGSLRYSF